MALATKLLDTTHATALDSRPDLAVWTVGVHDAGSQAQSRGFVFEIDLFEIRAVVDQRGMPE